MTEKLYLCRVYDSEMAYTGYFFCSASDIKFREMHLQEKVVKVREKRPDEPMSFAYLMRLDQIGQKFGD